MACTAVSWEYEVSPGEPFEPSANINYIWVPTADEVKKKIVLAIETYLRQHPSVLAQYWGAKEIGKAYVLTTTGQPFGRSGNNEELQAYRKACLDHKLYVYNDFEKQVAFGLPGRVFLNCSPEQTQNVHRYPADHRPPCENATIFTKIWGSFAVPVINDYKCIGVLEFVMDTPKVSCDNDILAVYGALEQYDYLHTLIQCDRPRRTNINVRERFRKTKSSSVTSYCCLVPYFGLSSARAAEKLGLKPGAFRDLCRNVGIPMWPWIRNTSRRASYSVPKSETSFSIGAPFTDLISSRDQVFLVWPVEQTIPGDIELRNESEYVSPDLMADDTHGMEHQGFYDSVMKNIDFDIDELLNFDDISVGGNLN